MMVGTLLVLAQGHDDGRSHQFVRSRMHIQISLNKPALFMRPPRVRTDVAGCFVCWFAGALPNSSARLSSATWGACPPTA